MMYVQGSSVLTGGPFARLVWCLSARYLRRYQCIILATSLICDDLSYGSFQDAGGGEKHRNPDCSQLPNDLGRSRIQVTCSKDQYYIVTGRCSYVPCMNCGRGSGPVITPTQVGGPSPVLTSAHRTRSTRHNLSQPPMWGHRSCYRNATAKTRRRLSGTQALSRAPVRGLSFLAPCLDTVGSIQRIAYAHHDMSDNRNLNSMG